MVNRVEFENHRTEFGDLGNHLGVPVARVAPANHTQSFDPCAGS